MAVTPAVGSQLPTRPGVRRAPPSVRRGPRTGAGTEPDRVRSGLDLARRHWLLIGLLVAAAALRALVMVAYAPALFFTDSWQYIVTAFSGHVFGFAPVGISNIRPSGYPALIWLLTLPGRDFTQLIAIQHLAGLVTGTLVYAALVRAQLPRPAAAAAAALVLLDGYAITLEQYVMADTFFALTVVIAALLIAWPTLRAEALLPRSVSGGRAAVAGLLLAVAVIQRVEGLFLVPLFVAYLVWRRVGWRVLSAFVVALTLPVLAYAGGEDARYGTFNLTQTSGWTLYGRVAGFANCSGAGVAPAARPLCESAAQRASHPDDPTWYIFASTSPAIRLLGPYGQSGGAQTHSNAVLGTFAKEIVAHQPLDYLTAVGGDVLHYFTSGGTPFADAQSATSLPVSPGAESISQGVRHRYVPGAHPLVRSPASLTRGYRGVVHVPRPLLGLLALASLLALALRLPRRREVLLLTGGGLALVVGSAATAGFSLRYLLPAVPLIAIGGTLAVYDIWRRLSARRAS